MPRTWALLGASLLLVTRDGLLGRAQKIDESRLWYFYDGDSSPFAMDAMAYPGEQQRLGPFAVGGDDGESDDGWLNVTRPAVEVIDDIDATAPQTEEETVAAAGIQEVVGEEEETLDIPDRSSQRWRPQVHFTPPRNWMNDPNGLFVDSNGTWHLYYQYGEDVGGNGWRHWGHATSRDLLTWTDHPIAIPFSDRDGSIWSGSVVLDDTNQSGLFASASPDNVVAIYTSWTPEQEAQAIAVSSDGGYRFGQFRHNPVISQDRHNFRDPKVSFHGPSGRWVMVLTYVDKVTFFSSEDLVQWRQESVWDPERSLGWIECPQFLEIPVRKAAAAGRDKVGSKWMLVLSINGGGSNGAGVVKYILGDFDGSHFTPEKPEPDDDKDDDDSVVMRGPNWIARDLDFGPDKYGTTFFYFPSDGASITGSRKSSSSVHDAISISWAIDIGTEYLSTPTDREGWRHCLTGARQHWIDADTNRLASVPAADAGRTLAARGGWNPLVDVEAVSGVEGRSSIIRNNNPALDFVVRMRLPRGALREGQVATAGLKFSSTETEGDDEEEAVSLVMNFFGGNSSDGGDASAGFLMARQGQRGWDKQGYWQATDALRPMQTTTTTITTTSPESKDGFDEFEMRGLLDRSILEVYLNGGAQAGTMLYFTAGVLDHVVLVRGADELSSQIEFDFKLVALRSTWAPDAEFDLSGVVENDGEKGGEAGGEGRGAMAGAADWTVS